jgi:hypothetical protein
MNGAPKRCGSRLAQPRPIDGNRRLDELIGLAISSVAKSFAMATLHSGRVKCRIMGKKVGIDFFCSQKNHLYPFVIYMKCRRGWDSNPRDGCPSTPLAGERLRPLGHLSGPAFSKHFKGFGNRHTHSFVQLQTKHCRNMWGKLGETVPGVFTAHTLFASVDKGIAAEIRIGRYQWRVKKDPLSKAKRSYFRLKQDITFFYCHQRTFLEAYTWARCI